MALHWPTFFTRLGSAIVFAAVMMAGLLWNEWSFAALAAIIQALCIRDYFRLMEKIQQSPKGVAVYGTTQLAAGILLCAVQLSAHGQAASELRQAAVELYRDARPAANLGYHTSYWPALLFLPALIFLVAGLSAKRTLAQAHTAFGALLYISLPCILLLPLYRMAPYLPLVLILCIWMNDTMAYLVGSVIGRTPFSVISPKKTWEGTVGGAVLTLTGAGVAAWRIPGQSVILYLAIALCAAIAGTAGDLLESKLKRTAGVKDSGTMMPGHGGALDRFDSLLIASPFAFSCAYLLHNVILS